MAAVNRADGGGRVDPETLSSTLAEPTGAASARHDPSLEWLAAPAVHQLLRGPMRTKKIFISYASQDVDAARSVHAELSGAPGVQPWFDQVDLLGGVRWDHAIRDAIRDSDAFIFLMSETSTAKRGYVQREVRAALDVVDSLPESSIFILPLRLDPCDPHFRSMAEFQYIDMFPDWQLGVDRLRKALHHHLDIPPARSLNRRVASVTGKTSTPGKLRTLITKNRSAGACGVLLDKVLVGLDNGTIVSVNPAGEGVEIGSGPIDAGGITCLAGGPTGNILLGTDDGQVATMPRRGGEATRLAQLPGPVRGVYLSSSDGTAYATCGTTELWAIARDGRIDRQELRLPAFGIAEGRVRGEVVVALATSDDGALVHLTSRGPIYEHLLPITALQLCRSPGGTHYAVGHPLGAVQLLDYSRVSPGDGAMVETSTLWTEAVPLYDDIPGEAFDSWMHASPCVCIAYSPSGRLIAGGHAAGQLAVWDATAGQERANTNLGAPITGIAFFDEHRLLATTGKAFHMLEVPKTVL